MRSLPNKIRNLAAQTVSSRMQTDFGRYCSKMPVFVIRPKSIEDVQVAVEQAKELGLRMVCRGHGCSSYGQSLTDQILLDLTSLDRVQLASTHTVSVEAGCTWGKLQGFLTSRGLTSGVVVSNHRVTIGGTLAVGGFGPSSLILGAVVEQVEALTVVTGTGRVVHARQSGEHKDLLQFVLCGLGQVGIIVRAELKVRPYHRYTLLETRCHPRSVDLEQVASSIVDSGSEGCRFVFLNASDRWKVELTQTHANIPSRKKRGQVVIADYFAKIFRQEQQFVPQIEQFQLRSGLINSAEDVCRIWTDFFLPSDKAPVFFEKIRPLFSDCVYTPAFNGIVLGRESFPSVRLPLLPIPEGPIVQSLGPYSFVPRNLVPLFLSRFDAAADCCRSLGGRQYLYGYHQQTNAFYNEQFGSNVFAKWKNVKTKYDPTGILGPVLW
jgi:cytokinin dehydrogenase